MTLGGLMAEDTYLRNSKAEDQGKDPTDGNWGENGSVMGASSKSDTPIVVNHIDVAEDEGWITIPYKELPDNWSEASDILSFRSLDRCFVFPGEQVHILACLSAYKQDTEIITPFKVAAMMSKNGVGKNTKKQNGNVGYKTHTICENGYSSPDSHNIDQNGENLLEEKIDAPKDISSGESLLRMEDHRRQTQALLQRFENSHFFVRISESDEPLWSKRNSPDEPLESSEMITDKVSADSTGGRKTTKSRGSQSAVIDRGNFDARVSGGLARNAAKCCSLSNGDIMGAEPPTSSLRQSYPKNTKPEGGRGGGGEEMVRRRRWRRRREGEEELAVEEEEMVEARRKQIWLGEGFDGRRGEEGWPAKEEGRRWGKGRQPHPPTKTLTGECVMGLISTVLLEVNVGVDFVRDPVLEIFQFEKYLARSLPKRPKTTYYVQTGSFYSMSSLPPNTVSSPSVTTPSSRPNTDLEDWDQFSSQKSVNSKKPGSKELLSFRADCNTDDLLCVQIKNVSPAHAPDIVIYLDAITVVFEEVSKGGPHISLPIACIEAGNGHSLPNLALRRGEEHSFILKPATSMWKTTKGRVERNQSSHSQVGSSLSLPITHLEGKQNASTADQYAVLTLQASNLTSEDLTLTVLAPASFTSPPSVVSLNSYLLTPMSPFVGHSELAGKMNGERGSSATQRLTAASLALENQRHNGDGAVPISDVLPSTDLVYCGYTRCVPSQSTATIKLELLPLTDGIITLDSLQVDVKEKVCRRLALGYVFAPQGIIDRRAGVTYVPEHSLKINATSSIATGIM
ncbi:hypothetical protein C3L33_02481, partial [Rhododendron williamsianum]